MSTKKAKKVELEIVDQVVETLNETPTNVVVEDVVTLNEEVLITETVELVTEELPSPVEDPLPVLEVVETVPTVKEVKLPEVKLPDVDPVSADQEYMFTEQRVGHFAGSYGLLIRTGPKEEENALIVDLRQFILRKRPTEVIVKFMELVRSYGEDVSHREAFQEAYRKIVAMERAAKKAQKDKVKELLAQQGPLNLDVTQ